MPTSFTLHDVRSLFQRIAPHYKATGEWPLMPLMLVGDHGIGKTQLVEQLAAEMGIPVITRVLSQAGDGEMIGFPTSRKMEKALKLDSSQFEMSAEEFESAVEYLVETFADYDRPEWFLKACQRPVLLFLDEIDSALKSVFYAAFQLASSKMIWGMRLHPGTILMAAVNGAINPNADAYPDLLPFSPSAQSRWAMMLIKPSGKEWLAWAEAKDPKTGRANIIPVIRAFIEGSEEHLDPPSGEYNPSLKTPDRRSWHALSRALEAADLHGGETVEAVEGTTLNILAISHLGDEVGAAFSAFYKSYKHQIPIKDILNDSFDGKLVTHGLLPSSEIMAVTERLVRAVKGIVSFEHDAKAYDGFCRWMSTIPTEVAGKFLSVESKATDLNWPMIDFGSGPDSEAKAKIQQKNVHMGGAHPVYSLNAVLQRHMSTTK